MKRVLFTGVMLLCCYISMAQGFKIEGELRNFKESTIELQITKIHASRDNEKVEIPVKNGKFIYNGEVVSPYSAVLIVNEDVRFPFILYNEKITIAGDVNNPTSFTVKGGAQINQYNEYKATIGEEDREIMALWGKIRELSEDNPEREKLQKEANQLSEMQEKQSIDFIEKHPDSGVSAMLYWRIYSRMEVSRAIELFERLDAKILADNSYYKFCAPTMIAKKKTAIGSQVPAMSQPDPEGNMISLADFKGKYLLIDFWASWCVPCRAANPGIVVLYEKFKDNNFVVLGISLDNDKDKWLQAIKQDGLTWPHISDLKGWDNEISRAFGVNSIPATVLVDPEGEIIARDLKKEELEKLLNSKL